MAKSTPVKASGAKKKDETPAVTAVDKEPTTVNTPVSSGEEMVNVPKSEWESMKAQMAALIAGQQMVAPSVTPKGGERSIKFVNMTTGTFVLKGTSYYSLEGQFASRSFTEHEARIIAANMTNSITNGMVFIADAQFVQENDFIDAYQNLLTVDQLKGLLDKDAQSVVEAYKVTSAMQKDIIVSMIKERRMNGQFVDMNVVSEIGKLCHEDLAGITADDGLEQKN